MATVVVTQDYELASGETLTFTDESAFSLVDDLQTPSPDISISGDVTVTASTANSVEGVVAEGGFFNDSAVTIEASGSVVIHSTTPNGDAAGMDTSWAPDFNNYGLLEVSADSMAIGFRTSEGGMPWADNRGTMRITAHDTALGVVFNGGANFHNSGLIEVTSEAGYAYGVSMSGGQEAFNNEGTIRVAIGDTAYGGVAAQFSPFYRQGSSFTNDGWIEGPVALQVTINGGDGTTVLITNNGTMKGEVDLGYGPAHFVNTGNVFGNVDLGEGADSYEGQTGRVTGIVHGGLGDDTMIGGAGSDRLDGGDGNDTITAGDGNDWVSGGAGDNTLNGGAGLDTLSYETAGAAVVVNLRTGVATASGQDSFAGFEHVIGSGYNDLLTGGGGDDTLTGGAGNDRLDGGAGSDVMDGGQGDDVFFVNSSGDSVIERAGQGIDTVNATVSYTLGANLENLTLTGTAAIDGWGNNLANILRGNSGANHLVGGAGVDSLYGGSGADLLEGGTGADYLDGGVGDDTMIGGSGNDTFVVSSPGDTVVENAGEGVDTVRASVSYSIEGQDIENLVLLGSATIDGTGNALVNTLTGNGAANHLWGGEGADTLFGMGGADFLYGGGGNDRLDGGAGSDVMSGGTGNDIYIVDSTLDAVVEAAGEGSDRVEASVSFSLAGQSVETLVLTGTGAIRATGNEFGNTIIGNDAANRLEGGGGADSLTGGGGADTFAYTNLSDSGSAGIDTIKDFQSIDRLDLGAIDANGDLPGDGAFVRIGDSDPFTAPGQMRLFYDGAKTRVLLNTDSDTAPEMTIFLLGNHTDAHVTDNWVL